MTAKSKTEPAAPRAVRNVKTVPIDAIHIDPGNVRVHPEKNKATIRASLARFGAGRSIVLDGHNVVRAGNGTVEQAREAGYTEVLVVEPGPNQIVAVKRPDWSDSVGTAYSIADNTSTDQSEDDQSRLAATLSALRNEGFDLAAMGHSSEGLDELLKTLADEKLANGTPLDGTPPEDPGPQIDRADELQKKWGTASGQLWLIPSKTASGEHRLLCGDSTKAEDVGRVMGGEKVDALITDPPYGKRFHDGGISGVSSEKWRNPAPAKFMGVKILGDESPDTSICSELARVLKPGCALYLFSQWMTEAEWIAAIRAVDLEIRNRMIWVKPFHGAGDLETTYGPQHESIIFATNGRHELNGSRDGDIWQQPVGENGCFRKDNEHPNQKPLDLISYLLKKSTSEGMTVLDPFLGSGTTIVAAEQTGRLCRGIEIAPKYIAVALERLAGMGLEPRQP